MVTEWLEDCLANHSECQRPVDTSVPSFIPTRLLDLGLEPTSDFIAIIDGRMMSQDSGSALEFKYAALSYCWGAGITFTTTSKNVAAHQAKISIPDLPLVFQEAILVARQLRLRYLWIDALCILQDDRQDWERESKDMPYIFAYAFVTIGAATSASCDSSFLQRSAQPSVRIPFHSKLNPEVRGYYSLLLEPCDFQRAEQVAEREFSHLPWNHRAWVYQEQRLATRLLIFGRSMLQLRCRRTCRLENNLSVPVARQLYLEESEERGVWSIEDYSRRKLTQRSDRLGALSGIAHLISKAARETGEPNEYLAGLWYDTEKPEFLFETSIIGPSFWDQLCWRIRRPTDICEQMIASLESVEAYCAPSWSWASRNGEVAYMYVHESQVGSAMELCELLHWDLAPRQSDPMIAVKPGSSITLKGFMRPLVPWLENYAPGMSELHTEAGERSEFEKIFEDSAQSRYHLDWLCDYDSLEDNMRQQLKVLYVLITCRLKSCSVYGLLLLPKSGDVMEEAFFREPIVPDNQIRGFALFDKAERRRLHTNSDNVHVLRQVYRRVGAFKSTGHENLKHYCPKVEVTII
jgi:hypothetical protein